MGDLLIKDIPDNLRHDLIASANRSGRSLS
jgi:hypothetical protein